MYIKKKDKELFKEIDDNLKLPKNWDKFIDNQRKKHNLILKYKNYNHCSNCSNEFEKKIKVNDYVKCPRCHQQLLVKSGRIKNYTFKDSLGLLDKYQDKYIIRYFELASYFKNGDITYRICEYGRKIFDNTFYELHELKNDNVSDGIGYSCVNHKSEYDDNWRYFTSYWKNLGNNLIFYPYNIKSLLNGTKWQYSQLWILAKKEEYFDIAYLLKNYIDSIELLIKLKLYKLAFCPKTFSKKGSFEERFGVKKELLPYMQKYNIDIHELEVLKLIKNRKDIRLIKKYSSFNLDTIKKYNIDIFELDKRTDISKDNIYEYNDYLRFAKELKYNMKDKKILYPKIIKEEHDKLENLIEVNKNKKMQSKIKKRYNQLIKNKYHDKKYIIVPAKSVESMLDESEQMNNCVKTYVEKYASNECDIYFMRLVSNQNKSLVTVEVRNNKVVQKRTKHNENTTKEQDKFLNKFEKLILNKVN